MDFIIYYIRFKNVENQDIEIQLQDFDTYEDPPTGTINVELDGAHTPVILDTVESDDDVTKTIKGKRLSCGFNSGESSEDKDVENFADGDDGRFLTRLGVGTGPLAVPFLGNLVLDDNQEAFQPTPNPVQLRAGEGLGSLKDIRLRESDGDVPVGHFRIIDYIYLCLRNLIQSQELHVAMNLFELDTDPDTSHAFLDTHLDALTFETEVNERDDCYTVLMKILDAFGCFICYDHDGWYIIRWTEYDDINDGTTVLRFANFIDDGDFYVFQDYDLRDVDKIISHDGDPLYEGYRLSNDNALKRFQRRAHSVKHIYEFETPKELPCNSAFIRGAENFSGTMVDDEDGITKDEKRFDIDCWTTARYTPNSGAVLTATVTPYIRRLYLPAGYEQKKYVVFPNIGTGDPNNTIRSTPFYIETGDILNVSCSFRFDSTFTSAFEFPIGLELKADDGTFWYMHQTGIWFQYAPTSPSIIGLQYDYSASSDDKTQWATLSVDGKGSPRSGFVYVHITNIAGSGNDMFINNIQIEYLGYVGGAYKELKGQENTVTGDNDSRRNIEHRMYISDSPKRLYKGAMKKFDGTNYVPTETWNYYNDTGVLSDTPLGKHTVFAWWNQFRKTRTVIETDIQGLKTSDLAGEGTPGLIHRWQIIHGNQEDKYFMLTSFRGMDFYLCAWNGVFVELSSGDGDRVYTDTHTFKFIQGE